ncbi:MAG: guanylate kinase [Verrucomicrobiales bacterium]|nr:guanylate kinase [Verrucomicrobiales bacterium]
MNNHSQRKGILCVVSGPSGSGKTTLCRAFNEQDPDCSYAISCTTRPIREGEVNGKDYHFLDEDEFLARVEAGDLLEHARVHGNLYGTLKSSVIEQVENGKDVLIDIDVQGAALIRENQDPVISACYVDIFVMPASQEELEKRLGGRGTESAQDFDLRMQNAREEIDQWEKYHYAIISGTREEDLQKFSSIIHGERNRARRLQASPQY